MTETKPTAHERGARRHAPGWLILLVIAGAQMMVVLDATIVNVALPSIGEALDKPQTDLTWVLNSYALAFGGLLLVGGRSGDIFGRRRMFMVGLGLFTLGSFLGGIAPNFELLLAGRVVQGLGGAIASPTALSLVTVEFEEGEERNKAIAVYAAVSGGGAAIGLLLGGVLTSYLNWRWVLFVNVPIGIALLAGAFLVLHESERHHGRLDLVGALLSVLGLVATVYGFIHVASDGWGNTETYAVFAAAVVLLAVFVFYEGKIAREPMMPLNIFENRNRSGAYLIMLVAGAGLFGLFYFITFFVQIVREYGALKTGVGFLPIALTIGVTSQVVSKLIPKTGPKVHIIIGSIFLTASLLWLARVDAASGYPDTVLPGILLLGFGMGNLFVPLTLTAVSGIEPARAGLASALLNVGQQIGGALGLSVMTTVFGTSARNYFADHGQRVQGAVDKLPGDLPKSVGGLLHSAGNNAVPKADITDFVDKLPASQRGAALDFFHGPYRDFTHDLVAHASGQGFLAGAAFGVVAIIAAVFVIAVKKSDVPSSDAEETVLVH